MTQKWAKVSIQLLRLNSWGKKVQSKFDTWTTAIDQISKLKLNLLFDLIEYETKSLDRSFLFEKVEYIHKVSVGSSERNVHILYQFFPLVLLYDVLQFG